MTGARHNRGSRWRAILWFGFAMVLACGVPGWAHSALLYLEDNGDGTIYIEAGFSDGASGAGMAVRLEDGEGQALWEGVLDDFGAAESVAIPEVRPYYVVFEGGPGHEVRKEGIYAASAAISETLPAAEPEEAAASSSIVAPTATVEPSEGGEPIATSPVQQAAPSSTATPAWTPAVALGAGWSMSEPTKTDQAPYATVLWVIAALLAFIALQLALVAFGTAFLAGAKFGVHRSRVERARE